VSKHKKPPVPNLISEIIKTDEEYKAALRWLVQYETVERWATLKYRNQCVGINKRRVKFQGMRDEALSEAHKKRASAIRRNVALFRAKHDMDKSTDKFPEGSVEFFPGPEQPVILNVRHGEDLYRNDPRSRGIPAEYFILDWKKLAKDRKAAENCAKIRYVAPETLRIKT